MFHTLLLEYLEIYRNKATMHRLSSGFSLNNYCFQEASSIALWIYLLYFTAGGATTGADETKSAFDRTEYGGFANAKLDTCYHQVCRKQRTMCSLHVG